jgi:AcrR family transcriptional regulator
MRRTKEDAALTRENLLDAALASFHHAKGCMATTLDDIAHRAGITRGAIAWHFGSKAELLNAVIRERYARASTRMLVHTYKNGQTMAPSRMIVGGVESCTLYSSE